MLAERTLNGKLMSRSLIPSLQLFLLATVSSFSACDGETIPLSTLPFKPAKASFVVDIQTEPLAGDGYQPFHITITPRAKRFARDHRVTVRLTPRNQFVTSIDFATEYHFLLEEGKTSLTQAVYVPYYYPWENIGITIFQDGRAIETGHSVYPVNDLRRRFAQQNVSVGILIPSDAKQQNAPWKICPDVRTLVTVIGDGPLPEDVKLDRLKHKDSMSLIKEVQPGWVQFRPLDEPNLHEAWLGYSQLDVIIAAAPLLARIEASQPQQMSAMTDWIAAGGNLWVYAIENGECDFLDQCGLQAIPASRVVAKAKAKGMLDLSQKNDTSDLIYDYWNNVRKASQDYTAAKRLDKMKTRADVFRGLSKQDHPFARTEVADAIASKIRSTKYGLGTVVAIDDEDPFPGSFQFWKSVVRIHGPGQIRWGDRNGVRPSEGDQSYWTWLIESVGQPPVTSFIVLNTLFVIVIGPIAYFFFRSRERLYLLFFFAPVFALLVTSTLFAYAMFADGTATRVRTRQLTWMDTKHKTNTTQSRQTYYAVFGSGDGLSFKKDVAVFPIRASNAIVRYRYHGASTPKGTISHGNTEQKLAGSFLPARNQVQYLTFHPNSFDGDLSFVVESESMSVTNNSPLRVDKVVTRDHQGRFWLASNVSQADSVAMDQTDAKVASALIDNRVVPDEAEVPMMNANRSSAALALTGLLEAKLSQWQRNFPRGHFVAIAELNKDELGVDDTLIQDSVHVFMGALP